MKAEATKQLVFGAAFMSAFGLLGFIVCNLAEGDKRAATMKHKEVSTNKVLIGDDSVIVRVIEIEGKQYLATRGYNHSWNLCPKQ